jgi:hypothetical protein
MARKGRGGFSGQRYLRFQPVPWGPGRGQDTPETDTSLADRANTAGGRPSSTDCPVNPSPSDYTHFRGVSEISEDPQASAARWRNSGDTPT